MANEGTVAHPTNQVVHLTENVVPVDCPDVIWVLDTGASNHMTGCRSALSHIDEDVRGTIRFGDGSTVDIQVRGSMVIQG